MLSPVDHVGRLGEEDVAKGGVAGVGGAGEHHVVAVDLAGEEHRVAVEGDEGVLDAHEGLEVLGLGHADGRAVEVRAPHDVVGVLHLDQAGVVGVAGHEGLAVFIHEGDLVLVDVPVDGVLGVAHVDVRDAVGLLAAQHRHKAVAVGSHGAVEDAGHALAGVAVDDGVAAVSPERGVDHRCGLFFPGDVGEGRTGQYLGHANSSLLRV